MKNQGTHIMENMCKIQFYYYYYYYVKVEMSTENEDVRVPFNAVAQGHMCINQT